jgi:hypothetical protein
MGIRNSVEIKCDYAEKDGHQCKTVVHWCLEDVKEGVTPLPDRAKTFISLTINGVNLAFCSKLHAAKFFLPDGYTITQNKVIEFPKKELGPEDEEGRPENGQEGE